MVIDTPDLGVSSNTGAGARGVFGGGYTAPGNTNVIQYITISSTGNSLDFGDLPNMLVIYDGVVDCIEQLVLAVGSVKNALYPGILISTSYDPDTFNANDPDPASANSEF